MYVDESWEIKWIDTPKTDWKSTDKFNYTDYTRIVENMKVLKAYADRAFLCGDLEYMESKNGYESMIYADDMNAIERNISGMNEKTLRTKMAQKTLMANGRPWNADDLNRIERFMVALADEVYERIKLLHRLPVRLTTHKYYVG